MSWEDEGGSLVVKSMSNMHGILGSSPAPQSTMAHAWNPSIQKVETGRSKVQDHCQLHNDFRLAWAMCYTILQKNTLKCIELLKHTENKIKIKFSSG